MKLFWTRFLLIQLVVLVLAITATDGGQAVGIVSVILLITNMIVVAMTKRMGGLTVLRAAFCLYILPILELLIVLISASF